MTGALVLPWPARTLHPNARTHWAVKGKVTKAARKDACWLAVEAGWDRVEWPDGRLHLWLAFYPPDRRRRDADNLLSNMKAAIDGIADALKIDDSRFVHHPFLHDEVRRGGQVRVRITGEP